jgi:photosystem II stability/assembly factor-like uncharacterized protein
MKKYLPTLATVYLWSVTVSLVQAQWFSTGPFGGEILCGLQVGGNLFAGTQKGIYKSIDGGQNWTFHHAVDSGVSVGILIFDGTTMYTGTVKGVYVSPDTGRSWTHSTNTIGIKPVNELVQSNGKVFVRNSDGLFFTVDQGQTWVQRSLPAYLRQEVYGFGNTLFKRPADLHARKLYRSTDDGQTWMPADSGLGTLTTATIMNKIGNELYTNSHPLMYKSADGGISWQKLTFNPFMNPNTGQPYFFSKSCTNGQKIFASPGGNTYVPIVAIAPADTQWTKVTGIIPEGVTRSMFTFNTDVFVCKDDALYRTHNNGQSWTLLPSTGMSNIVFRCVAAYGTDVFCGSEKKVFYSTDNGQAWAAGTSVLPGNGVNDIFKAGNMLLAALDGDGIYKSTDNGQTWVSSALSTRYAYRFAEGGNNIYVGVDAGVFRSTNNGASWGVFANGIPAQTVVMDLLVLGSNIYGCLAAGMGGAPGVYKSPLSSSNWVISSNGLTPYTPHCIEAIGSALFAGTERGVFKSTDFAATWRRWDAGIETLEVFDLLAVDSNLYAATEQGVWVNYSGDSVWTEFNMNLPTGTVNRLAKNATKLFAATSGLSVWQFPLSPVGTDAPDIENDALDIFPNPASGEFYLQGTMFDVGDEVGVFDLSGKEIFRAKFTVAASTLKLHTSNLENGVYFLRVKSEGNIFTRKLIVQK